MAARRINHMTDAPTEALIYCRISADRTGEALGVQRQEAECRELADRLGYEVADVLVDNDISATTGRIRPAFEELLTRRPRVVIVWHTDRLLRLTRDLERVLDCVGTVHAVTAGDLDLSTPAGRAVARTVTAWATYEGEQKSLRQKARNRQDAEAGKTYWRRHRPFGFERDGSLRADEAELVRMAYRMFLRGASCAEIARHWEGTGYRWQLDQTERDRLAGKEPAPPRVMDGHDVRRILQSARNAGLRTHDGEIVGPGAWESIITEETYGAAMAQFDGRKLPPDRGSAGRAPKALLSGFSAVTCGVCDRTVVQRSYMRGNEHVRGTGYGCRSGHATHHRFFVDAMVLLHLVAVLPYHKLAAERLATDDVAIRARELELALEGQERRRTELADQFADGALSVAAYSAAEAAIAKRIETTTAERQALAAKATTARELADAWNLSAVELVNLSAGEKRELIEESLAIRLHRRGYGKSGLNMRGLLIEPKVPVPTWWRGQVEAVANEVADAVRDLPHDSTGIAAEEFARIAQRMQKPRFVTVPPSRVAEESAKAWGENWVHPGEGEAEELAEAGGVSVDQAWRHLYSSAFGDI